MFIKGFIKQTSQKKKSITLALLYISENIRIRKKYNVICHQLLFISKCQVKILYF